ncbi:MAG: hypothetical protein JWQ57_3143 [Mucilaginibacter sp.]|nr:hypothetical protein [Mucilaginibacter sp.]
MKIKTEDKAAPYLPPLPKSYSVDEILAAGGATAFAVKMGFKVGDIIKELQALPPEAFLTDEEVEAALVILRESK